MTVDLPARPATGDRPVAVGGELPRFRLLAHAVAGRRIPVFGGAGERSWTDGESIFLAELPEELARAAVAMQAALLAAGSFEPWVLARIAGRRTSRLRYLTCEAVRAAALLSGVLPPGPAALLAQLYHGPVPGSTRESLAWALQPRRAVPEAPPWLGTIKPVTVLRAHPSGVGGAPTERDRAGTDPEEPTPEFDDEDETESSTIMKLLSSPLGSRSLSTLMRRLLGAGRSPGSEQGGGAETPTGGNRVGRVGEQARTTTRQVAMAALSGGMAVGRRYPEWDLARQGYRPDWCSVAEFDPPASGAVPGPPPAGDRRLLRQLARLGLTHERYRRQAQGDSLDLTALVELVVDRAAGVSGDPRVYESRRRTAHDLGVLVLLDATGSTGESTEGRQVFERQRDLAARLTAALDELGDRVATYGFFSQGRHAVRFLRVKDFDDRYDHAAHQRLSALNPGGYTRLGAAVRHGVHLLRTRAGTSKMLLVVVGDGFPYDEGYESRYAQEDSHQALREAVAQGVGCLCLSVGSSTDTDVIERVWGEMPHHSLDDPGELSRHVLPLLRRAMGTAEASRRPIGTPPGDRAASRARDRDAPRARDRRGT